MPMVNTSIHFFLKDCALIALATGKKAQNLRELNENLRDIDANSIYYHFWGGLLRARFDNPEYHNDFAIWIAHSLHNKALAEQLAVIDPIAFDTMDDLRKELIEIMEENLDDTEFPAWAKRDDQFEFIRSQIVVFDTGISLDNPADLLRFLPQMSLGSVFYHFIEGRRRNPNSADDFRNWLFHFGEEYEDLCTEIGEICPYFKSLKELRAELLTTFTSYFEN
jgi:hypothetical protein